VEWNHLWVVQDGICPICGKHLRNRVHPEISAPGAKIAAVDHDKYDEARLLAEGMDPIEAKRHSIRGLLCTLPCNYALADRWYKDDCKKMKAAIAYCADWPARGVL